VKCGRGGGRRVGGDVWRERETLYSREKTLYRSSPDDASIVDTCTRSRTSLSSPCSTLSYHDPAAPTVAGARGPGREWWREGRQSVGEEARENVGGRKGGEERGGHKATRTRTGDGGGQRQEQQAALPSRPSRPAHARPRAREFGSKGQARGSTHACAHETHKTG